MTLSFLPKPLLFKEWKEHRWWLIAALVLLIYIPLSHIFALAPSQQTAAKTGSSFVWHRLIPVLYHVQYDPGSAGTYPIFNAHLFHARPVVSAWATMISVGLVIVLMTVERGRRTVAFTFSFPIRRVDALRVKILMALSVILSAFFIDFLVLLACDVAVYDAIPLRVLWQWLGVNLLISMTCMSVGFACASVIRSSYVAGAVSLLVVYAPWALGFSMLRSLPMNVGLQVTSPNALSGRSGISPPLTFAGHLSMLLRSLSPTSYFAGSSSFNGSFGQQEISVYVNWGHPWTLGIILWFVCITIFGGFVGVYGYVHAPIEHFSHEVMFPRLKPWLHWVYYGAFSFIVVNAFTGSSNVVSKTPYLVTGYWLGTWLVIGLALTGIRTMFQRQTQFHEGS